MFPQYAIEVCYAISEPVSVPWSFKIGVDIYLACSMAINEPKFQAQTGLFVDRKMNLQYLRAHPKSRQKPMMRGCLNNRCQFVDVPEAMTSLKVTRICSASGKEHFIGRDIYYGVEPHDPLSTFDGTIGSE